MPKNKIYLANLNKTVTDTLLKDHFSKYGDITEIHLPIDNKSQAPKGYGFITFAQETSAEKALELDGTAFLENEITVQFATEKRAKK